MMNEQRTTGSILFLTLYAFGITGGIEKVCRSLAKALTGLGLSFDLYAMHDSANDLDNRYLQANRFRAFSGRKLYFGLASIFKGVFSNTIILSHVNLLVFAWVIKKIAPQTKIILYAHGIEIWGALSGWKKQFLQEKVEIWAVSTFTAAKIAEMHQIDSKNITVLNNCLDPYFEIPTQFARPIDLLQRYHLQAKQPILFTLTRLSAQEAYKGYDQVLSAMPVLLKKFPDLHYLLAGKADEQEYNRVKDLITQLGLSKNVTLTGFIKDEELSDHFKLGSLFVMPSTLEGFGIVFIEAAACGAKIIAGNVDGSTDALLNGKLGALVDPTSIAALISAIEQELLNASNPLAIQNLCLTHFAYPQYLSRISRLI
ncbi:MAG: glycosyltransferase family 4 protein [Bacteroidota bacterium]